MNSTDEQHFLAGKSIIIAGAGIGGLTLCIAFGQLLDEKIQPPPSIIIYERDISADPKGREGYSISIRENAYSGSMRILKKLNILDEIVDESNPGRHATLFNKDFSPLVEIQWPSVEGISRSDIRITRSKLREILLKNVPSSVTINWNSTVKSVDQLEDGQVLVYLENGTEQQCDLLIAVDGVNSVIRKTLLPEHVINFTSAVNIAGRTYPLKQLPAPLDKTWGGALGGDGHCLFIAPYDRTSVIWNVSYLTDTPREPKSAGTITDEEIDEILTEVKERTKVFSEPMPSLLQKTLRSSVTIFNNQDITPFRNHGSIIFIGDAQHAMSPFAGNGANMAIMDAYQLVQQLVHHKDLNTAINSYDDLTIPRSTAAINLSHRTISVCHSQGILKYIWVTLFKMMTWYYNLSYTHDQQSN